MPPQSRGTSPATGQRPFSKSESLPPTLRPYLENLPSPTALIPDQRTPTGPRVIIPDRDNATPTPTPKPARSRASTAFELGFEDQDGTEDEDVDASEEGMALRESTSADGNDEAAGVTLDDDDFESHYSRQESSESESEENEEETGPDEGGGGDGQQQNATAERGGSSSPSSERPDLLSRVRSLPARPSGSQAQAHSQFQQQTGSLHTSQSTTSLPPPPPPPLYPPFYNRPPTPLPPSPSLTSLLRPPSLLNRSTASTRPTTPDSSDVETPNDTEAAVAHSARRAHPLPPTSPKVPTYEYYGFVLYLASTLAFIIYILWSYLPSPFLHALGITYYPNRWWSLAIPAWIVILLIFIYVALLSYNVEYLTLPLGSLECMVDEAGNVAILDESGRLRKGGSKNFVKELKERAKMELEMEMFKTRGGKGRKFSKSGGSGSHRQKDKGKRRSSRAVSDQDPSLPPEVPAPDSQISPAPFHPSSHNHATAYPYQNGSTHPFLSPHIHPSQIQHEAHTQAAYPSYPNWKLIWNESTDAVMDVPIGGVCEVLYG